MSKALLSISVTALVLLGITQHFLQRRDQTATVFDYRPIVALSLLYVSYLVGCLYSSNQHEAVLFLLRSNGLWLSPLAVALHTSLLWQHYPSYFKSLVGATLVASIATLGCYWLPETALIRLSEQLSGIWLPYTNLSNRMSFGLYSPFLDRLQLGNLISLSLMSLLWLWQFQRQKIGFVLMASTLAITQLMLGARTAQLSGFVSMGWLLLVIGSQKVYHLKLPHWNKTQTVLFTASLLTVLMVLLPYLAYHYVTPFQYRYHQLQWEMEQVWNNNFQQSDYTHFTTLRRLVSWKHSYTLAQQHFFWGVGTGDYYDELKKIYANDQLGLPPNSHSQYLQIWATVGLVGLLIFVSSLLYWLYALYQKADTRLFAFGSTVLLYYFIAFIFDAFLLRQIENTLFPLFLALIYTLSQNPLNNGGKNKNLGQY